MNARTLLLFGVLAATIFVALWWLLASFLVGGPVVFVVLAGACWVASGVIAPVALIAAILFFLSEKGRQRVTEAQ
jgi:hypothetical protein